MKRCRAGKILLVALIAVGAAAHGATWYAGDFLAVGVGPRAIGMGSAVIAIADGAEAPNWNPAGLAATRYRSVAVEHAERFAGIVTHDAITGAIPLQSGVLGFSVFRGAVDGIGYADSTVLADPSAPLSPYNMPDPSKMRTFSNADYVFHVAYGRSVLKTLRVGGAVKFIKRSIDRTGAFGYGLDVGAQWNPTRQLALGVVMRDAATTRVSWDNGHTDVVYPSFHVGSAYTMMFPEQQARLTLAAGSVFGPEKGGYGGLAPWRIGDPNNPGAIGAEFSWRETVMIRVGSRDVRGMLGPGASQMTAGFGVRTALPWLPNVRRLGLDLAWLRHTLRDSYRLGAVVEF